MMHEQRSNGFYKSNLCISIDDRDFVSFTLKISSDFKNYTFIVNL